VHFTNPVDHHPTQIKLVCGQRVGVDQRIRSMLVTGSRGDALEFYADKQRIRTGTDVICDHAGINKLNRIPGHLTDQEMDGLGASRKTAPGSIE